MRDFFFLHISFLLFLFQDGAAKLQSVKPDESGGCGYSAETMEHELRMGLSVWAIVAIVCNSVVAVLMLILFVILYKACKVPSSQEKVPAFPQKEQTNTEHKYLLTAA